MIVFYRGYLPYLMSDFVSAIFCLAAVVLVLDSPTKLKIFFAGILCSATLNIRMAYILVLPVLFINIAITSYIAHKKQDLEIKRILTKLMAVSILFIAGFMLVGVSQLIVNNRTDGSLSVFPKGIVQVPEVFPTDTILIPLGNSNITTFQLSVGLSLQRYETRLIKNKNPAMYFHDADGERLIRKYLPIESPKDYLYIWKKEPLAMSKINSRHLLNGFDANYAGPFPTRSEKIPLPFKLLWYFTFSFTIIVFLINAATRLIKKQPLIRTKRLYTIMIITLATFVTTIPSAIEPRFFIFPTLISFTIFTGMVASRSRVLMSKKHIFIPVIVFSIVATCAYMIFNGYVHKTLGPLNQGF